MAFYNNYVRLCAEKNMSPSAAALAIGLKKSNVTYWKNERNNPSDVTLAKIANFFGVTVAELMADDPSAGIKKERPADGEALSPDTQEIYDFLNGSSADERAEVRRYIQYLKSKRSENA